MFKKVQFFILLLIQFSAFATTGDPIREYQKKYNVKVKSTGTPIIVDGVVNPEEWKTAAFIPHLNNHWPSDSGKAEALTHVYITYDDKYLYIAAVNYDNGNRIIQSLKRDNQGHWSSDAFSFIMDPVNTSSNGYFYGVNAGGAQVEGAISSGGQEPQIDWNWDNKWFSETTEYDDRWEVEMAIPLKTIRFEPEQLLWGINFIRNDMQRNAYSTWTQFPVNFEGVDLGYTGGLQFEQTPKAGKGRVVLFPYVSGGVTDDYTDTDKAKLAGNVGFDAKVKVTSVLNLDLSLNPDFSNADVDVQQTNLTRFSLFFPERRGFFLENADLFSDYGGRNVKPFFSRQIGVHDGEVVPILYGARLSGNVTEKTRVGVMNVQTQKKDELAALNYTVASVQQRVFARSTVKALFINKQDVGKGKTTDFNRNYGGEFNYLSKDGKLNASVFYHGSSVDENYQNEQSYFNARVQYRGRTTWGGVGYGRIGGNYRAETGFTPRLYNYDSENDTLVAIGYTDKGAWLGHNFFTKNSKVLNLHGFRTWHVFFNKLNGDFQERNHNLVYEFRFKNTSRASTRFRYTSVFLPFASQFAPDKDGQEPFDPLPSANYSYWQWNVNYNSDERKKMNYSVGANYGTFYNGELRGLRARLGYRAQPWGNFSVRYNVNRIVFPENYGDATFHLIGPEINISFSNKIFWNTFIQYNTQANNINVNSRFQWRYLPMSDIFVVYSDNYAADKIGIQQRGLIFKVTYRIN